MAINVTIGESKTKENAFPKIMISPHKDYVVFVNEENQGIVIWSTWKEFPIGTAKKWSLHNFTDYNEPITLQNQ